MVLANGVYLFNVFCAMVPCSVTQPPPQAFISKDNYTTSASDLSLSQSAPIGNYDQSQIILRAVSTDPNSEGRASYNPRVKRLRLQSTPDDDPSRRGRRQSREQGSGKVSQPSAKTPEKLGVISFGGGGSEDEDVRGTGRRRGGIIPSLFSAVPVIPLLLNNFNNMVKSNEGGRSFLSFGGLGNNGNSRSGRKVDAASVATSTNSFDHNEAPITPTQSGTLEGYFMGTMKGRRIAAYEGVPYAEPPLGKYRFKSPVPRRPWKDVMLAKKKGSSCMQAHPLDFFRVTGDEDCLFLNVYTPKDERNKSTHLLPVVFLIHGGSFQYGAGAEYGPAYLLDEDVVLVTTNYRLGPLGFLSTGDAESPGNYGLKDQALALKWVNQNIAQFGGDPSRVTIMGQSAGGVSAHMHLIANKTTGFFRNGVSLSGTAFGFWPIISRPKSIDLTNKLARAVNCRPSSSSRETVRCLRSASAHWIIASQMMLYEWIPFHPLVLFGPVIEEDNEEAFLTRRPEDAYASGEVLKMPWIFGQTSQEGHFDLYFMRLMMQSPSIALNGKKYLPLILGYGDSKGGKGSFTSDMTSAILKYYGGSLRNGRGIDMTHISDMYTDRFYTSTIRKALRAHGALVPDSTFAYVFDYKGKYNLGSLFGAQEHDWGVSHTEDMFYYFNSSVYHHGIQRKDREYELSQIMTDYLSNFIAKGRPVHTEGDDDMDFWDPAFPKSLITLTIKETDNANKTSSNRQISLNSNKFRYLRIRKDIKIVDDPFEARVRFWDRLNLD